MDLKEKQMFEYYYNKIITKKFDEKDIYAFFILIRRFCKGRYTGLIRELSDFIAHRKRSRGKIFKSMKNAKISFDKSIANKSNKDFEYCGFTSTDFFNEINYLLQKLQYNGLDVNITNEILLCIFSILQFTTFENDEGEYGVLKIFLVYNKICLISCFEPNQINIVCSLVEGEYYSLSKKPLFPIKPINVIRDGEKLKIVF